MIFDEVEAPKRNGVKKPATDSEVLRAISTKLSALLDKPTPAPIIKAPEVTVNAPAPKPPIKKWKFTLTRDSEGRTKEIIATAME